MIANIKVNIQFAAFLEIYELLRVRQRLKREKREKGRGEIERKKEMRDCGAVVRPNQI